MSNPDNQQAPSLLQVIASVLAAAFGVQSSKNRERDFQHGNVASFVTVGIIATVLLILLIYSVVTLVLG